jgi:hypothetical protein
VLRDHNARIEEDDDWVEKWNDYADDDKFETTRVRHKLLSAITVLRYSLRCSLM